MASNTSSASSSATRTTWLVNRIKAGEDPVAEPLPARHAGGPTAADLAARYMEEHVAVRCKGSTADGMRKLVDKHSIQQPCRTTDLLAWADP